MTDIAEKPHVSMLEMTTEGLAMAASVVSSITHVDTELKIFSYGMIGLDYLYKLFDQPEPEVIAISQLLQGAMQGHVLLMMNHEIGMQVMRGLLRENARLRELTEMEEEALLELGNIIINSCLCSYLKLNKSRLISHLPRLDRGHYSQIMNEYRSEILDDEMFFTQIQVTFSDKNYLVCLLWTQHR